MHTNLLGTLRAVMIEMERHKNWRVAESWTVMINILHSKIASLVAGGMQENPRIAWSYNAMYPSKLPGSAITMQSTCLITVHYAFSHNFAPVLLNLVATNRTADTANAAAAQHCNPRYVPLDVKILPATGWPSKTPQPATAKTKPMCAPMARRSGDNVTVVIEGRLTKALEH